MATLLLDIGSTSTRICLAPDGDELTTPVVIDTLPDPEQSCAAIVSAVQTHYPDESVAAVVVGMHAQLDEDKAKVSHLQADDPQAKWVGFSVKEYLAEQFAVPVWIENSIALAGLAEAHAGAGKDFDLVVYHTIDTEVGGVRIDNGEIDHASIGFEPGHQILDIDRTVLGEDISPTLENLVSATAVENRMNVAATDVPQDDVMWDQLAHYLGQGLRNSILYWSPEVIVLAGSMVASTPGIQIDGIRRHTVAALDGVTEAPFITVAALGEEAVFLGAIEYLKQHS